MKIIHSYFTEGYFEWAKFLVESIEKSNGNKYKIILSSRNLPKQKQDQLRLYKNIEVINKNLDYSDLAKRAGIKLNTLMQYKSETEKIKINSYNWVWKLMISAEDRIREIRRVANTLNEGDLMLNLDVDSYVRKPLAPWFDLISQNDFSSIIKYEKQLSYTTFHSALRRAHITPRRFSKYCIGMSMLNPDLKQNLFKEKVRLVRKINNEYLQSIKN